MLKTNQGVLLSEAQQTTMAAAQGEHAIDTWKITLTKNNDINNCRHKGSLKQTPKLCILSEDLWYC